MKRHITGGMIPFLTAAIVAMGGVAAAGSSTDPEMTDPAGDANGVSVQTGDQRDTRPASIGQADLRAAWFETAFGTNKIRDPESGEVVRAEHVPTGLLLRIRTELPISPPWQSRTMLYRVMATIPSLGSGCQTQHFFVARATPGQTDDAATLYPSGNPTYPCNNPMSGSLSYNGNVATLSFSFTDARIAARVAVGTRIDAPLASSYTLRSPGSSGQEFNESDLQHLRFDRTAVGRPFTVGSDVPPDVDCSDDPTHPECQS
jgi:hypothetical protein